MLLILSRRRGTQATCAAREQAGSGARAGETAPTRGGISILADQMNLGQ